MSKHHDLKCWPQFFDAMVVGDKTFEVRLNDRDYQPGDTIRLHSFKPCLACNGRGKVNYGRLVHGEMGAQITDSCPTCDGKKGEYLGFTAVRQITYVLEYGDGLEKGYCCLGIKEYLPNEQG